MFQCRGKYSHASITLSDGRTIESREFIGVHCLPELKARKGETIDIFDVFLSERQEEEIAHFLIAQLGKPYDYLSICRFITREPVPHWERKSWFCSELSFEAFRTGGIELLKNIAAWAVSPELLGLSPLLKFRRRIVG